jgi:hypothetical protein
MRRMVIDLEEGDYFALKSLTLERAKAGGRSTMSQLIRTGVKIVLMQHQTKKKAA